MDIKFNEAENGCYVLFEGSMICKDSRTIEQAILEMVRRHPHLKVDLSEVNEIDSCGIHLLAMIKSFGVEFVEIVATSPIVDVALAYIPSTRRKSQPMKTIPEPRRAPSNVQRRPVEIT